MASKANGAADRMQRSKSPDLESKLAARFSKGSTHALLKVPLGAKTTTSEIGEDHEDPTAKGK